MCYGNLDFYLIFFASSSIQGRAKLYGIAYSSAVFSLSDGL